MEKTIVGTEVSEGFSPLDEKATLKDVVARVNALAEKFAQKRDRGPDSEREMTAEDARRAIGGDLKGLAHRKAAEALGLSYGQVYSARLGFTFKAVSKELGAWKDPNKK